jgi:pyruvate dehydrogenase E2 component (dihydrolipoyllysine-residue acetyltransferase)
VIRLADLGEGLTEAEVIRWLVAEGEAVSRDQPLVEVETDKAVVEIPSPIAGTVAGLLVAEGERASVGEALVEIVPDPDGPRPRALPRVRALAASLGVDIAGLNPDGGTVTEEEVRAAAHDAAGGAEESGTRVPLRGVRREIATHMTAAAAIPTVTVVEECDFSALAHASSPYLHAAAIIEAAGAALAAHPELNATLQDEQLVLHDRCDIGYAVQGPHGLVVPVVRGVRDRTVQELADEVERIVERARSGTIGPQELRGGTFTITDARRLGGLFATPLLNAPQVGILGVHRVAERPVVRDGEVVVRPVGLLSVGFDHRALDGAVASGFLIEVVGRIERAATA